MSKIYVYKPTNTKELNQAFDGCYSNKKNPIKDSTNLLADIRDLKKTGNIYIGYLANLRTDNLPHLAEIHSIKERKLVKNNNEALLEKSHFLYSKTTGYLFFQVNVKAFRNPNILATIFTNKTNKTVSLNPVLTTDAQIRLRDNKQSIFKLEIDVASPDISLLGDSSIENSIKYLSKTVSKVKLSISNDKRSGKFFDMQIFKIFQRVDKVSPSKFKAYSSELDEPIDLVMERESFTKKIKTGKDGYISSKSAYEKLEECRQEFSNRN